MPGVDMLSDMDAVFAKARAQTATADTGAASRVGARNVVIVTPGRILLSFPMLVLDPGHAQADPLKQAKSILHSEQPLSIAVIAYTKLEVMMDHEGNLSVKETNRSIPFLGHMMAFAYAGHVVVVFEGHPSAFEAGVRNTDVLIVDSAMLPFLQTDWAKVAFRAMSDGARIFVHDRKSYTLLPVVKAKTESGWQYTEPDGEASYVNCLLTTMAKAPRRSVLIVVGSPLPNLAQIATDVGEQEWVATLPFKYDQLDVEQVMDICLRDAERGILDFFTGSVTLKLQVAVSPSELRDISFKLTEKRSNDGKRQLVVEAR
jgi:hypothetical protein